MSQAQWKMQSDFGAIYLVASAKGLQSVYFGRNDPAIELRSSLAGQEPSLKILREAVKQLGEYLSGQRRDFDLPFDTKGTEFQRKVWGELAKIPYGKTYSYRELAEKVKNPGASRAVGSANGKNPLCIIVPCHRVIAADGSLGGYSGGLTNKTKLLELEKKFS